MVSGSNDCECVARVPPVRLLTIRVCVREKTRGREKTREKEKTRERSRKE